jgi:hypothetical protein
VYAFAEELIDPGELEVVSLGRFSVIAERIEETKEANAENAIAFDRTIWRLWSSSRALIPARFGTVVNDVGELVRAAEARRDPLERALAFVTGRAQMTLRLAGKRRPQPAISGAWQSGTDYLRKKLEQEKRSRSLAELDAYRRIIDPLLVAERVESSEGMPWFASAYHLVERTKLDRYHAVIAECRERLKRSEIVATSSGPWAPYAFAPGAPA